MVKSVGSAGPRYSLGHQSALSHFPEPSDFTLENPDCVYSHEYHAFVPKNTG